MPGSDGARYPEAVASALTDGPTPFPRRELADGTRLSHETARRLCCDTSLVRVTRGPDGAILDLGRRTRTITPALRRALEARDRGCRFPGCGQRFTSGHPLWHWVDGGPTKLANTLLLCRYHHRLVHEGGWQVSWWGEGRPVFIDPRGGEHVDAAWQPPEGHRARERREGLGRPGTVAVERGLGALADRDGPAVALVAGNRAAGADPDASTASARWLASRTSRTTSTSAAPRCSARACS